MPLYEYACDSCDHLFEVRQRFSDEPVSTCPKCGAPVRRVLHAASVIFKGPGFYLTDNRKAKGLAGVSSESKSEEPPAKTDTSKTTSTTTADK